MKLFLLIALFISTAAIAQDSCVTADVSTVNMPKNNDQNQLAWCFAWSTADLISFHEQKAFSSYDIAVSYHHHYPGAENKKFTEMGGGIDSALVMLQNLPSLCLEKDTDYTNGNWEELSKIFKDLDSDEMDFSKVLCHEKLQQLDVIKNLSQNVFDVIAALPSNERLASVIDLTCGKRQAIVGKYDVMSLKVEYEGPDKLLAALDTVLSKNEPVSIGYDIDQILKLPEDEASPYPHASTVIGRRVNPETKKCEYQIKNSWGNSCPKKSKIECHEGNLWVSKEVLKKSLSEVSFMMKK